MEKVRENDLSSQGRSELLELTELIQNKNLPISQVIRLVKNLESEKIIEFNLRVDYTKTVEQAIAAGNYARDYCKFTSLNYSIPSEMIGKNVKISARLFHFNNRLISAEKAEWELSDKGYRPANLMELLALGATRPGLQKKFSIIALGSICEPIDGGPQPRTCLTTHGTERSISISWPGGTWGEDYRFLGVRK
ncbi:MAG: hypothetical protein NT165_00530 [Candidatus Falkowbacteria bacterium]|nr:hypothetical protein [Candidatus Falkowbacteria bacterium]